MSKLGLGSSFYLSKLIGRIPPGDHRISTVYLSEPSESSLTHSGEQATTKVVAHSTRDARNVDEDFVQRWFIVDRLYAIRANLLYNALDNQMVAKG